eukprot:scaffold868_cov189-Ochromonas_danica.AAC.2
MQEEVRGSRTAISTLLDSEEVRWSSCLKEGTISRGLLFYFKYDVSSHRKVEMKACILKKKYTMRMESHFQLSHSIKACIVKILGNFQVEDKVRLANNCHSSLNFRPTLCTVRSCTGSQLDMSRTKLTF